MGMRYLAGVATLRFDREKCRGCGLCTEVCPHRVFSMKDNKAAMIDKDACMECGACAKNCPFAAITVDPGVGCAYALLKEMIGGKKTCGGAKGCGCS